MPPAGRTIAVKTTVMGPFSARNGGWQGNHMDLLPRPILVVAPSKRRSHGQQCTSQPTPDSQRTPVGVVASPPCCLSACSLVARSRRRPAMGGGSRGGRKGAFDPELLAAVGLGACLMLDLRALQAAQAARQGSAGRAV